MADKFWEFYSEVDRLLLNRYGVSLDEVHIFPLERWCNEGLTPRQAANIISEEEGLE